MFVVSAISAALAARNADHEADDAQDDPDACRHLDPAEVLEDEEDGEDDADSYHDRLPIHVHEPPWWVYDRVVLPALAGIFGLLGCLALDEDGWVLATPWILCGIFGVAALATQ